MKLNMKAPQLPIAIVGSGPAGLMAATVLAEAGLPVVIFEKKKGPAKKLLIAGASGLNVTYAAPLEKFTSYYRGKTDFIKETLQLFTPTMWLKFIEALGVKTFLGTSHRYFVEGLKAPPLLKNWIQKLKKSGVQFAYGHEVVEFNLSADGSIALTLADGSIQHFAAVCFCLGGGSYEPDEKPLRWPSLFTRHRIGFRALEASNVGFELDWPTAFLQEAEGLPLKNIQITSPLGVSLGDVMITNYGVEGTPVYSVGKEGPIQLDLKPDLDVNQILKRLNASTENLASLRRIQKYLNLSPAALALLYHLTPKEIQKDLTRMVARLKNFPLEFKRRRPLDEAISTAGGVDLNELDANLMLKKIPGIFVAGEMLDWDAPTGGFLIQACVSQGYAAGRGLLAYLEPPLGKSPNQKSCLP